MAPNTWKERLDRQKAVLKESRGHFIIIASYRTGGPGYEGEPYLIEGQSSTLSEEFLRKHAYDLGVQNVVERGRGLAMQAAAGGDCVNGISIDWGTGATASLFSGREVSFQEGTSYSTDTVVKSWDDIDRLRFDPENRWAQYELAFWRGVSSAYVEGIAATPHLYRSPLDLANDLRGNRIFEDMYLEPEQVERLVSKCADMIIDADRFFKAQIPLLREAPGGVWGIALPESGMIMVNGDPVDLISPEMGERFNHSYIERLIDYAGALYFHHHTLGVSRVTSVAKTRGLTVQQFTPDPKCPRVYDILNDTWVEASKLVPIDIWQNILEAPDVDAVLEMMRHGRFIIHLNTMTLDECLRIVGHIRRLDCPSEAACAKTQATTLKELFKDPSWPVVLSKFKASKLQAPVADIAAARLPRPGLGRQVVPFMPEYELADIRDVHGGADGVVYIEAAAKLDGSYRGALAYGSDGPVKVWVNGRAVDCRPAATNPATIGQYVTPVSWKKGVNRITFALATNHGNAWGVQARVLRNRDRRR